jgi:serine/threonine protein kinase
MLDDYYNLKIIDFGDARKISEELDDKDDGINDGPGRRDTFVGTVNY